MTKRRSWHSVPMMKMITGAEVGRQRGAQRRNQTQSDSSSTLHLRRRRMIARYGAGWRDSWQRGLQRRWRRRHRPPQCHFLMPPTKRRLLPRPKRCWNGVHPVHRRRRHTGRAKRRRKKRTTTTRWSYVCPGLSTLGITAVVPRMRRGCGYCRPWTVRCCRYAREPVAGDAADIMMRTRAPCASYFPPI